MSFIKKKNLSSKSKKGPCAGYINQERIHPTIKYRLGMAKLSKSERPIPLFNIFSTLSSIGLNVKTEIKSEIPVAGTSVSAGALRLGTTNQFHSCMIAKACTSISAIPARIKVVIFSPISLWFDAFYYSLKRQYSQPLVYGTELWTI